MKVLGEILVIIYEVSKGSRVFRGELGYVRVRRDGNI